MGNHNACDLAQLTHEGVLRSGGCLDPCRTIRYRQPLPSGPLFEGLIIDDYVCLRIHPTSERPGPGSADAMLMTSARRGYREARLEESTEKRVLQQSRFMVWGTSVDSDSGRVGAPSTAAGCS